VNDACDAGAAGKQAPDHALIHTPTLARGSPARSRKLAGGVGLGIGGIVNVNQAPPGRKLMIAHGEDTKAKQRCDRAVKDTKVKNIYRAHDLRTLHSRTVIERAHYHHPHPIDARVELLPSHALNYEARLVLVKELHSRGELEADCAEKFRWILTNEESQRVSALQRSRVAKHQAQLLQRERQFAASAAMNDTFTVFSLHRKAQRRKRRPSSGRSPRLSQGRPSTARLVRRNSAPSFGGCERNCDNCTLEVLGSTRCRMLCGQ
jgi:hypothetical protein